MKSTLIAALAFAFLAVTGNAQSGGVAILDIDAVARELGVEEKVRVDLLGMQNALNQELQKTQGALQNQMTGVERAAGQNPTEEQRRQIVATNQQLNSEFNRLKTQAQNTLASERVRLINEFRIKLEPIALEAAKSKNLDVVLMKVTPPVFAFSNAVDITEKTTELARKAGMEVDIATAAGQAAPAPATPVVTPTGKGGEKAPEKAPEKGGEAKSEGKE